MALLEALPACGTTTINYVVDDGEPPFVDVASRDGSKLMLDSREMDICDARPVAADLSLDGEGFRLVRHATRLRREDFRTRHFVDAVYLREMEAVIQSATGADLVMSSASPLLRLNSPDAEKQKVARPAPLAHSDYTEFTFQTQLAHEVPIEAPAFADFKRVEVYQTWRALSPPPQDSTLMFCSPKTVDPAKRVLSRFRSPPPFDILEFFMYQYDPANRWYYISNLTIDEVLLFKGYEGEAAEKMHILHSGADVPGLPAGVAPRESIETRAFAFFRE